MKRVYQKLFVSILLFLTAAGLASLNTAYAEATPNQTAVIDLANAASDRAGQGWFWDVQKKVWTLSGIDLTNTEQANLLVLLPADTVIHLEDGSINKITSNAERIVLVNGDLKIEGAGRLILDGNHNMENQALRVLGNLTINGADLEIYNCGKSIACQAPNETDDGWIAGKKFGDYGNISIINSNIYIDNVSSGIFSDENQKIKESAIEINNSLYWGIYSTNGCVECDQANISINGTHYGVIAPAATINNSELSIIQQGKGDSAIYLISWSIRDPLSNMRNLVVNGGSIEIQSEGYGIDLEDYQQLDIKNADVSIKSANYAIMAIIGEEIPDEKKIQIVNSSIQLKAPISVMVGQIKEDNTMRDIHDVIGIADDMRFETTYSFRLFKARVGGNEMYLYTLLPQETSLGNYLYDEDGIAPGVRIVSSIEGNGELKLVPKNDSSAAKKEAIAVYVNGQVMAIDPANDGSVYIDENGRTIVPLRALAGALGITVEWDSEKQTITIPNGPKGTVVFTIGSKEYSIDGAVKNMDTTAVSLPPGRTHVPLRFVAESLGAQVEMTSAADGRPQIQITTRK